MSFDDDTTTPTLDKAVTRKETNLYLCKMDIFLPRNKIPKTRTNLAKLLSHVDPGWKFIRIRDCNSSLFNLTYSADESLDKDTSEASIQSLSAILFLNETRYEEVLGTIHSQMDIWQLRHTVTRLNNDDKSAVTGCMNFFELSVDLPLWAISPIHFGNKVLRFNIFVKDFDKMKEYYEKLILQRCDFLRKGFCIFKVHSYPGLEVQISLKIQLNIELRSTRSAVLRLKFRKLDAIRCHSVSVLEQMDSRVWRTQDPEGNVILLEEIGNTSRGKITKRRSNSEDIVDELVFV